MTDDIIKEIDKKNLFFDSYAIVGISAEECRSILMDWMLSTTATPPIPEQAGILWRHYAPANPAHPMTGLLFETMNAPPEAARKRRGGRKARTAPRKGKE